ncbi:Mitochondrial carrier domain protein [Niveomyces insectorum RCEF 264]|uniref:Mitochondrial carrier domain protein n=1 Tax=Niveomyces insectorum RCEF 264 TaxID=1081102 RepID=A0A167S0X6_9HYPO|nr:Mitochondrial carrier domain protein [Niveomyces insectorum RCEF 264]
MATTQRTSAAPAATAAAVAVPRAPPVADSSSAHYKGFVAGVFSGIAKLSVGHPFDTIKVRMQTTSADRFPGPLACLVQTVRHEGVRALYKGASPPLVGWMFMDSVMLGAAPVAGVGATTNPATGQPVRALPAYAHGVAGMLAGATVSFIAAPVEHVKARLQVQYAARKADRLYQGPVDCATKLYRTHGLRHGLYHGLGATLLFRSFFFFWWGSYDVFSRLFRQHAPQMPTSLVNFWAGGLSAQVFWLVAYPSDVVKQRIMTDPLGGRLQDGTPRFPRWRDAARAVYQEGGARGFFRGFMPSFLRAFPANAMALVAFEAVMRTLP